MVGSSSGMVVGMRLFVDSLSRGAMGSQCLLMLQVSGLSITSTGIMESGIVDGMGVCLVRDLVIVDCEFAVLGEAP
jgi:hypothetical protein